MRIFAAGSVDVSESAVRWRAIQDRFSTAARHVETRLRGHKYAA